MVARPQPRFGGDFCFCGYGFFLGQIERHPGEMVRFEAMGTVKGLPDVAVLSVV